MDDPPGAGNKPDGVLKGGRHARGLDDQLRTVAASQRVQPGHLFGVREIAAWRHQQGVGSSELDGEIQPVLLGIGATTWTPNSVR